MAPPDARVHLITDEQWSIVARRQPDHGLPANRYKNLRISRLIHFNKFFPAGLRHDIKDVATYVSNAFRDLRDPKCCVAHAIALTTTDGHLRDPLVANILRLRDLLDRAYASPSGAEWIREFSRPSDSRSSDSRRLQRTASTGSDTSSSARPRRREEPSSGRGNSKRASLTETSDSEDHQPEPRGRHIRDYRKG